MLRELTVENLAVVESCTVRFAPGLNVISGETGAGKSVILGALGLVLGGRGSTELVRAGETHAQVRAVFVRGDEELVVRRRVPVRGSGRSTLNGEPITRADLQALGRELLCITGQHDQRVLLDPDQHEGLLDGVCHLDRAPMAAAWTALVDARSLLRRLQSSADNAVERALFLRFQLQELDALALQPGEAASLEQQRRVLLHSVQLREAAEGAESELYSSEGSAVDRLSRAMALLERVSEVEPAHAGRVERLAALVAEVEDLGRDLQEAVRDVPDPGRLDVVEERLQDIDRMVRKHGCTPVELPAVYDLLQAELRGLDDLEAGIARATTAVEQADGSARQHASELHAQRATGARRLDTVLSRELGLLAMPHARFVTNVAEGTLGPTGFSQVELRLTANPGEPPRALHRVASGGELSRVLLALKLHVRAPGAALVFDEIDAGIGGRTAEAVGQRIAAIARSRQLLCISHLPQIASLADAHFAVLKSVSGGRTFSTIRALDEAGRVDEVARMIGGSALSGDTRDFARKLLQAYARVA